MVPCHRFSVLVSVTCTLMFVLIIFSSIKVAEWERSAHSVDHMFPLYVDIFFFYFI